MPAAGPAAIVRFALDLHRFDNVDLFQRGQYQVRISVRLPQSAVVESHATSAGSEPPSDGSVIAFKGPVAEITSPTLPVKYKGQSFRIGASTDGLARLPLENPLVVLQHQQPHHEQQANSAISSWTLPHIFATVQADLYFHSTSPAALKKVSTRTAELRPLQPGCAFADTVTFSFFYTCSVQLSVLIGVVGLDLPLAHLVTTRYLYDYYYNEDDETTATAMASDPSRLESVDIVFTPRKQPAPISPPSLRMPSKLRVFLSPSRRHPDKRHAAYQVDGEVTPDISQEDSLSGDPFYDSIQTLRCYFLSVAGFYQCFGRLIQPENSEMSDIRTVMQELLAEATLRGAGESHATQPNCADMAHLIMGISSDCLGKLWNHSRSLLLQKKVSFEALFNSWFVRLLIYIYPADAIANSTTSGNSIEVISAKRLRFRRSAFSTQSSLRLIKFKNFI